jgi:hypothetical protein
MNAKLAVYLIALLLVCTGATCNPKQAFFKSSNKVDAAQQKIVDKDDELTDKGKAYVYATGLALDQAGTNTAPPVAVAKRMNDKAQVVLGPPSAQDATAMRDMITGLLSQVEKERQRGISLEAKFEDAVLKHQQEREKLQAELKKAVANADVVNRENSEKAQKWDELQRQNIFKRIWRWSLSTLGIGGIIALCIFCPAAIPILARIVAWIIGKIPALAGAIGVVSSKAFDAITVGVGQVRTQLKVEQTKPQQSQRKYTAAEVQAMLDNSLMRATDDTSRVLIEKRRKATNADKIDKVPQQLNG